jgi:hypothetical protein
MLAYLCSEQKDIFWVQIVKYEKSLQGIKRIWRNINRTTYNISARRATESDYGLITKKEQTFRV